MSKGRRVGAGERGSATLRIEARAERSRRGTRGRRGLSVVVEGRAEGAG